MHFGVFPSVAQIALIGIENYETAFPDQAETLCWFAVVLMYLGQSIGKVKFLMINRIGER